MTISEVTSRIPYPSVPQYLTRKIIQDLEGLDFDQLDADMKESGICIEEDGWTDQLKQALRNSQSQPVADYGQFREYLLNENPSLVRDLEKYFRLSNLHASDQRPVLLLPLRIETKFKGNDLRVRIYPDQLAVETHERALTVDEVQAWKDYIQNGGNSQDEEKQQAAYKSLVTEFGSTRAAWIAREGSEYSNGHKTPRDKPWTLPPYTRMLPDRFLVRLYRDDELLKEKKGELIPDVLTFMRDPLSKGVDDLAAGDRANEAPQFFDQASKWTYDYAEAEKLGMAVTIDLGTLGSQDPEAEYRVLVVGIKDSLDYVQSARLVSELLENHRYMSGLAFLDYGTPTNNTLTTESGYSERDVDSDATTPKPLTSEPLTRELRPFKDNASRLSLALGLSTGNVLFGTKGADRDTETPVSALQEAIWPATGDYFLREILGEEFGITKKDRQWLWRHFRDQVRARGPYDALRIGSLPYGILPIMSLHPDPMFDKYAKRVIAILRQLYTLWQSAAVQDKLVPRIGTSNDPDEELLQTLGMEPGAISCNLRRYVDLAQGLILLLAVHSWLTSVLSEWETPLRLLEQFEGLQTQIENMLVERFDISSDIVHASALLNLVGWDDTTPIVMKPLESEDALSEVLKGLDSDPTEGPDADKALFLHMLYRSWLMASTDEDNGRSTVEEKANQLMQSISNHKPADIDAWFWDILDLCTHRLDAWFTSFATKRLYDLRQSEAVGIYIGAYGYVESLKRKSTTREAGGYFHGPSYSHADAAAVMKNAYLTHHTDSDTGGDNPFCLNLTSERVRRALRVIGGVRAGQGLGGMLGEQFERGLHEQHLDHCIDEFREAYPMRVTLIEEDAATSPRKTVDGLELARSWREDKKTKSVMDFIPDTLTLDNSESQYLEAELDRVLETFDVTHDLLLSESVYQSIEGNYERAAAALDAASGTGRLPKIQSIQTPSTSISLNHRVCILFDGEAPSDLTTDYDLRAACEPRLAHWFFSILAPNTDAADNRMSGIEAGLDYFYVEDNQLPKKLLNLYTATEEELAELEDVSDQLASVLYHQRNNLKSLNELKNRPDITIDDNGIQQLQRQVVIGSHTISLSDLEIDPLDFLYMSATPPTGEQTELEIRIWHAINKDTPLPQGVYIKLIECRMGELDKSLVEAVDLATAVLELIGGSSVLQPGTLSLPEDIEAVRFSEESYKALFDRRHMAVAMLNSIRNELMADDLDKDALVKWLLMAARAGIPEAVPPTHPTLDRLQRQKERVLDEMDKRRTRSRHLVEEAGRAENFHAKTLRLIEAIKAIFGEGFVILPMFTLAEDDIAKAFKQENIAGMNKHRVMRWLQQAAQTHPALRRLEDVMMMTEAWCGAGSKNKALGFHVAQLPYKEKLPWLALSDDEEQWGEERPRRALSIVSVGPDMPKWDSIVGLTIDQWTELIPREEISTAVSFQYDQPNTQAPQTMLLAVSRPRRELSTWQVEDLAEIVEETVGLMKIRAVDLDAFEHIGILSPALFWPVNENYPRFESSSDTLSNMIEHIEDSNS